MGYIFILCTFRQPQPPVSMTATILMTVGHAFIVTFRPFIDTCFDASIFKFNFTPEANIPVHPTLNIF